MTAGGGSEDAAWSPSPSHVVHVRKLEDFPVEPMIHSLAVDARTHRVYAPAEREKGRPASTLFVFEPVTKQ
jgi:hypothetical protein